MQISPALRPHHIFALRPQAQAQATLLSQESKPSTDEVRLGGVGSTAVLDQARAMVAASKAETLAAPESVKQIEELIARALQDPEAERQLIGLLQALNATGQLKPTLHQLTQAAVDSGAIPRCRKLKRTSLLRWLQA